MNPSLPIDLCFARIAEFDRTSRAREFVTFYWEKGGWRPVGYDIWPTEWPVTGFLDNALSEPKAADIVRIVKATPLDEKEAVAQARFAGKYIGIQGWSLRLSGSRQRLAPRTCNVMATEQDTGAAVMMWQVLDGCQLPNAAVVTVFGKVRTVTDDRVELEAVRVLGQ
jgi:hypothetical protein